MSFNVDFALLLITPDKQWSNDLFLTEHVAEIPRSILESRAVSREIVFSSTSSIDLFRLEQRILFHGTCIETWSFKFGFVIPNSTNSWQQVIQAADVMMPAEELSGNLVIETVFYDGDDLIAQTKVRLFYV
jgi:retinal rod rhodopsin-sensitive cGMP 3',5'-cyclic phosphodiesterase subunit delta